MLIEFRKAIIENDHWSGSQTQAVAMGLELLKKMEAQYRVQVELSREHEKQMAKKAREEINAAGGKVSGEPQTLNPA